MSAAAERPHRPAIGEPPHTLSSAAATCQAIASGPTLCVAEFAWR